MKERGTPIDLVIAFDCDQKVLEERICGRRVHPPSGRSYHMTFNPPKKEGFDDETGEPLFHRADDTAEALKSRLESYNDMTVPIIKFYEELGILKHINATAKINEVKKEMQRIIKPLM